MKRIVNDFAVKSGYGVGFWTLLVGVFVAGIALVQIEVSNGHLGSQTQVERIPASAIYQK